MSGWLTELEDVGLDCMCICICMFAPCDCKSKASHAAGQRRVKLKMARQVPGSSACVLGARKLKRARNSGVNLNSRRSSSSSTSESAVKTGLRYVRGDCLAAWAFLLLFDVRISCAMVWENERELSAKTALAGSLSWNLGGYLKLGGS